MKEQRGHWWNRVVKGPRRRVTSHRTASRTSELVVPIVLVSLAAVTVTLVVVAIGIFLGVVNFK